MTLPQRLRTAWTLVTTGSLRASDHIALITKGSLGAFDRIADLSAGAGGEKLSRPFEQSPWVSRAIKLIALPMTEVPLRFSTDARGSKQIVDDPALAAFWESPALGGDKQPLSLADTIEATVGWLKLSGNAFWILDDTVFAPPQAMPFPEAGRTFPRFFMARPSRMRALKANGDGALLAWEHTDGAGRRHTFDKTQVIHLRLWNPYDDCEGLGEMKAAEVAAEADYLAGIFKRNLWRNNGDRGPIIGVPAAASLTDEQRKQLLSQLREKKELASRGIFKAAVLGGDIKVEDPKTQMVDAAFTASRAEDPTQIFLAFGVPPSMATVTASYSIGSASDRYRLIEDTCAPTGKKITEAIERVLALQFQQRLFAWFDWSRHSVFQQVRNERVASGTQLWDRGLPWMTISEWLSLDLPEFPGWDRAYLPFSVTPAGEDGLPETPEPTADEAFNEPAEEETDADESDEMRSLRAAFAARASASEATALCACGHDSPATPNSLLARARETALWRTHMARRRETIRRYESAFNRELIKARAETLAKLHARFKSAAATTRATASELMFNLPEFRAALLGSLGRAGRSALQTAGAQLFAELNLDDPFKYPPEKALAFLARRENKLSGVADDVHRRINTALEEGLLEGESIDKLSRHVKDAFNDLSKARARTIAMTETAAAYGDARQEAMTQAGVEYKEWLTSRGPTVRSTHAKAEGQIVPVNEPFEIGGEALMGPGDPSGSPGNVINCHCVAVAAPAPGKDAV